jgi:glyoxylase-like metal-dependent hydrolase (beta-lactamase superfamily II)
MDILVNDENIKIERYELGSWATNSYVITCQKTGKCVLVDVPPGALTLIKELKGRKPEYILLTHSHIDHITGLKAFKDRVDVPVAVNAADESWLPAPPEIHLNDGDAVTVGDLKFKVLHTPGHTAGSLCYLYGKHLISGDTIFPGGPGKTWNKAEFAQIVQSLTEKIFTLPDETIVYPGHGATTVLKKEKEEYFIFASRPHDPRLHGDVVWLTS